MDSIKKLIDYFKTLLEKKDKKKLIENFVIILIIGTILLIAGGSLLKKNEHTAKSRNSGDDNIIETSAKHNTIDYGSELEKNLASILAKIDGAGKVDVMITYVNGNEIIPAYEEKESENKNIERDSAGGTREVMQRDCERKLAYQDEQGGLKKPIIIKNIYPSVKGVVVVAEGAKTPSVKEQILRAVQVLMDVPIHKIQVLERTK
jgi:stage III sporulation protein AG